MMTTSYGRGAIAFHWVVALLVVWVGALGLLHDSWPKRSHLFWINIHALFGLALWLLVIARYGWRLAHPVPDLPDDIGPLYRRGLRARPFNLYSVLLHHPHHRHRDLHLARPGARPRPLSRELWNSVQPRRLRAHGGSARLSRLRSVRSRRGAYPRRPMAPLGEARRRSREDVAATRGVTSASRAAAQVASFAASSALTAEAASNSTCSRTDRYST